MIQQDLMSPNIALSRWMDGFLKVEQVISHTGMPSEIDVIRAAEDAIENEIAALEMWLMTPEEEEENELRQAAWEACGDYLREVGPPSDQRAEEARIMEAIRQSRAAKAFKFRRPAVQ